MNRSERSREAPMDFQFTSRPSFSSRPVWAENPSTPVKRSHSDMNPPTPSFPGPSSSFPTFGTNQNVPFLFNSPPPQTPHTPAWAPSPTKIMPHEELPDVDMGEVSPPKPEENEKASDRGRNVAMGAMRRVFKSRQKSPEKRLTRVTRRGGDDEDDENTSGSENDIDDGRLSPRKSRVQNNTSHHYTLNVPSPSAPPTDTPYVLLGYLQFFFNLSLVLVFLYLLLQFILTVQRDVEQRISEHSMDIVQEISNCATQFKVNLCGSNPVPAMLRQCGAWETCMNRDPTIVGRARVGAELIAEVVNGFVEPISWKTLAFTLTSLAFLTVFINALLSLYRSRHQPAPEAPSHHHQPSFSLPPPTPFPPQYLQAHDWSRSWNGVGDEDLQTPSRRRRLESGEAKVM